MSRFVDRTARRVELGDGDWAEIRTRLSYGDREAVRERLIALRVEGEAAVLDATQPLRLREGNIEVLIRAVMRWGGPGFCQKTDHPHDGPCADRPITRDAIEELDPETADALLNAIKAGLQTGTPDFTSSPSPHTATAEAETPPPADDSPPSSSSSGSDGPSTS